MWNKNTLDQVSQDEISSYPIREFLISFSNIAENIFKIIVSLTTIQPYSFSFSARVTGYQGQYWTAGRPNTIGISCLCGLQCCAASSSGSEGWMVIRSTSRESLYHPTAEFTLCLFATLARTGKRSIGSEWLGWVQHLFSLLPSTSNTVANWNNYCLYLVVTFYFAYKTGWQMCFEKSSKRLALSLDSFPLADDFSNFISFFIWQVKESQVLREIKLVPWSGTMPWKVKQLHFSMQMWVPF